MTSGGDLKIVKTKKATLLKQWPIKILTDGLFADLFLNKRSQAQFTRPCYHQTEEHQ